MHVHTHTLCAQQVLRKKHFTYSKVCKHNRCGHFPSSAKTRCTVCHLLISRFMLSYVVFWVCVLLFLFLSFNRERPANRSGRNVPSERVYPKRGWYTASAFSVFLFFFSRFLRACDSSGLRDMDHKSAAKHSMCQGKKEEKNKQR